MGDHRPRLNHRPRIRAARRSGTIASVTRPLLAVHGHFYQPERRDPFGGEIPVQPAAAPFRDWNARIDAECYKPNAERGNLRHISYDLGPTLAAWLAGHDPAVLGAFVDQDLPANALPEEDAACGNAVAQAYHHAILPLASHRDRGTEIRWGLRDFELHFGRRATGIWLPETAVDLPTLRILVDEGIRYTILAPWQAADPRLDTRRPYRIELGGRRAISVIFYDAVLSGAASFDPGATGDADTFASERVAPRLADASFPDGTPPLALIATDGELYGHHQKFRDLFLARLVQPGKGAPPRTFDVTTVGEILGDVPPRRLPATQIVERTSWSCHHGVARWHTECPDASDGRWKAPLRAAMDRLASAIDTVAIGLAAETIDEPAFWQARDEYVDVIFGAEWPEDFAARHAPLASEELRARLLQLMETERWRLAMFASDGWFWDDPIRPETKQVLLCAARAVRLIDSAAGTSLEARFIEDLELFTSPSRRIDGAAIYFEALSAAGQPI